MKLIPGFSSWMIFAAFLCFAPCALGQTSVHNKATGAASHVLPTLQPASLCSHMPLLVTTTVAAVIANDLAIKEGAASVSRCPRVVRP